MFGISDMERRIKLLEKEVDELRSKFCVKSGLSCLDINALNFLVRPSYIGINKAVEAIMEHLNITIREEYESSKYVVRLKSDCNETKKGGKK